jgi:hypothetical protein
MGIKFWELQRGLQVGFGTISSQIVKREAISTFTTPVARHGSNIILVLRLTLDLAEWRLFILIIFMLRVSATPHFDIINRGA